jgi:hypothetical protein
MAEGGSYVLSMDETEGTDGCAETVTVAQKAKLVEITKGRLHKVSSLVFDTCPLQLKVSRLMGEDLDLRHVICVLCDAHGLNLYLKDAFKIAWFKSVYDQAQSLTSTFSRSNPMFWLLQSFAKGYNKGCEMSIRGANDTRWISLINLFKSLTKLKLALKDMVNDHKCTLSAEIVDIIQSYSF